MQMIIENKKVNYVQYGDGEQDVVLLHGWGQNIEMMNFIGAKLNNVRVTIMDLPGFGESEEPDKSKNVEEYADWLYKFNEILGITNPIIIGHSFGGRIAVKYASKYQVEKLVLLATPIIRHRNKPTLSERLYKVVKKTPIGEMVRKKVGSADYNNATPIMRETLVKVVNEDLLEDAKKILVPTLLFAGTNDTAVSLEDTKQVASQMQDAAVIELIGTHYAYIENLTQTCAIINEFITPSSITKKR